MNYTIFSVAVETAAERMLHSILIGLVMAIFAWVLLRLLPRPRAATRFSVWFTALSATAILSAINSTHHLVTLPGSFSRPLLSIPGSWAWYFALGWAALSFIGLLRLVFGWVELRRLRNSCRAISHANAQWRAIVAKSCPSRTVAIVSSDSVQVPTAIGFLKPMIILPSALLEQLTPAEITQVLLHESAHLRRWDDWTNAVQKVIKALFFFHPAVWWMEEQVSLEREMACDDAVVSATSSPRAYAECLATLAQRSYARRSAALVQAAVHRVRQTTLRVARLLDANRAAGPARNSSLVVTAFACACVAIAMQLPQVVSFANQAPAVVTHRVKNTEPASSPISASSASAKPILAATRVPVEKRIKRALRHGPALAGMRNAPIIHQPQRPFLAANRAEVEPPFLVPAKGAFDMRATLRTGVVIIYVNDPVLGPTPLMFHFAVWEFVPAHPAPGTTQRNI